MVFIDVYDTIWDFLEKEGILGNAMEYAEHICGKKTIARYDNTELLPDIVLEQALFDISCNGELLVDYVERKLYPKMNEDDKKEFLLLKASKRNNLSFIRKEKLERKDTHGKDFYKFYFRDKKGKTKEVLSSTALDKQGKSLNIRLIRLPEEEGEVHAVLGVIFNGNAMELLELLKMMRMDIKL
ncbi:MAG: hypothetical protein KJ955_05100 [Nanoarchaeota archaeon]|nr:hypothetical protein [Nanoarchaeota archaeon]